MVNKKWDLIEETEETEQCMMQPAQNADKHVKYHSNQLKVDQYIVRTVILQKIDSKAKN